MLKTLIATLFLCFSYNGDPIKPDSKFGDIVDVYNEIPVYYNGNINHSGGRHLTAGGYNLGLKWQCVEFVKRFYFKKFGHRMRNSFGHAKDFFDDSIAHTAINKSRGLRQFKNTSCIIPQVDDIVVFGPSFGNPYGHIAIISAIRGDKVELVQQNVGNKTREIYTLAQYMGIYTIANRSVLGWMRMP